MPSPATRVVSFPLPGTREGKGTPSHFTEENVLPVLEAERRAERLFLYPRCLSCFQLPTVLPPKWHVLVCMVASPAFLLQMRKLRPQGSTYQAPSPCRRGPRWACLPHWLSTPFVDPVHISMQGIRTLLYFPSRAAPTPGLQICLFPLPAVGV